MPNTIPPDVLAHCAASLKVLAHPSRLRIAELLEGREHSVGELAEVLGETQPIVSQHLAKMRHARLVAVRRDGARAWYCLDNPACTAVLDCIRRNFVAQRAPRAAAKTRKAVR